MGRAAIHTAVTLALALAAPSISTAQGKSEAKQRFQKGVKLFKKGNHEGALVEFRAAYDAKPNWKVRYNIGMTLYKLNRYVEADVELRAYLLEGGDAVPEKTLTEVQSILFEIQSYIGTVDVSCDVMGAKIYVDGVFVSTYPLDKPLPLDVGEYVFELRAEGHDPMSRKVSVPVVSPRGYGPRRAELASTSMGPLLFPGAGGSSAAEPFGSRLIRATRPGRKRRTRNRRTSPDANVRTPLTVRPRRISSSKPTSALASRGWALGGRWTRKMPERTAARRATAAATAA